MSPAAGWPLPLPPAALRQPDGFTCGPTAVLVARMLRDPAYAASVAAGDVAAEVHRLHRDLTGWRDGDGHRQPPWPRLLGTPPWTAARALGRDGLRHRVRLLRWPRVAAGVPAPAGPALLYVGSRWLPRHVLVVVGRAEGAAHPTDALLVHDPARGAVSVWPLTEARTGRAPAGRWRHLWFGVLPG